MIALYINVYQKLATSAILYLFTMATPNNIAEKFIKIEEELVKELDDLKENFVKHTGYVFNPLEYAAEPHKEYVRKYCNGPKKVLFLGMNPGPTGMAQTGVSHNFINICKHCYVYVQYII